MVKCLALGQLSVALGPGVTRWAQEGVCVSQCPAGPQVGKGWEYTQDGQTFQGECSRCGEAHRSPRCLRQEEGKARPSVCVVRMLQAPDCTPLSCGRAPLLSLRTCPLRYPLPPLWC